MSALDDQCDFFIYGVRCTKRKDTKHYCWKHMNTEIKRETVKQDCCICLDVIKESSIVRFSCLHIVCKKCFSNVRSFLCPMCNHDLRPELSPRMITLIEQRKDKDQLDRVNEFLNEERNRSNQLTILSTDFPARPGSSVLDLLGSSHTILGDLGIIELSNIRVLPDSNRENRGGSRGNEPPMSLVELVPVILNNLMARNRDNPVVREESPPRGQGNRGRGRGSRGRGVY